MKELLDQIAGHCTGQIAGDCAACSRREPCREALLPLVDRLFAQVTDRWAVQFAQDRIAGGRYASDARIALRG